MARKDAAGGTEKTLSKHADHYRSMGSMPEALAQLAEASPEVFDAYSQMRAALLKSEGDGGALPLKYKHLILVVLDAIRDEPIGIVNHTRAAMLHGLSVDELTEGILLGIIVYGMPAWGKTGRKAVDFGKTFAEELAKRKATTDEAAVPRRKPAAARGKAKARGA